ncbi:hypothetical protein [Croceicoccus sp. BE223]|uniref:hypothetical protein n=1 Tax=Croceicoccus sp. BE223 TaxID=2817716 RepID=UPI0028560B7C|nr:hypothetical protein [Croceicoccus sp. BE223]MDR7103971.1 hypothetical protein [Croceicoccus sp. BE223]
MNIHPGEIRDELLIAEALNVEDQQPLVVLGAVSVALGTEEKTEFKGHVEAGEVVISVEFGPREIMDPVPAFLDQPVELLDPSLAAIVQLARRPWAKPACIDCENQRLEDWFEVWVEGTVYENIVR